MDVYSRDWYEKRTEGTRSSAEVIVPIILERVRPLDSVVDVGCGTGDWLEVFSKHRVEDVCGVDGSWIHPDMLRFPSERFFLHDLERPLSMGRRFDLVVSLEVAEHLASGCSETFVRSLTSLGDVILFSAAIPGQGGTNHVNLHWQGYWSQLFEDEGYVAVDCLRGQVWEDSRVSYYYAQNMIFYVERQRVEKDPLFQSTETPLSMMHPTLAEFLLQKAEKLRELHQRDLKNRLEDLRENSRKAKKRALEKLREQNRRKIEELQKQNKRKAEKLSRRLDRAKKKNRNLARQLQSMRASRSWRLLNKLGSLRAKGLGRIR